MSANPALDAELRALKLEVAELRARATRFGLVWTSRPDPYETLVETQGVGLTLDQSRFVGFKGPAPAHLLVEGDNLAGLRAIKASHASKVDVIYIDPPYNTGNTRRSGFSYSDRFRTLEDEERHSSWLSMMLPRLEAARDLLKPTGAILISIDDNEAHHLRVLCDQVFGEHNFIAQMVWDGGNIKNNAKYISGTHEYVLVYARSLAAMADAGVIWREPRPGTALLEAEYSSLKEEHGDDYAAISAALKKWVRTAPLSTRLKVFTSVDARGLYTYADLSAPGGKGARYDVLHPVTGRPCQVPSRGWGCKPERMQKLLEEDRILFGEDESAQPMRKLYLSDKTDQVRRSILPYPARSSTHLIEHMLGRRNAFNNPKNLEMMMDLVGLVGGKDAVVLDFFAGSGTTAHAVLELNASDGGSRSFIMMTNNENSICDEVTLPRIKAAMTGTWGNGTQQKPLGGFLVYARAEVLSKVDDAYDLQQLAGLVFVHTGVVPEISSTTATVSGPVSAFTWDGAGRRADAQRILDRLAARTSGPLVVVGPSAQMLDLEFLLERAVSDTVV